MRFDSSFDLGVVRSESVTDLNSELMGGSGMRETRGRPSNMAGFGKVSSDGDHISPSPKPFGLGEYAVSLASFFYFVYQGTLLVYEYFVSFQHGLSYTPAGKPSDHCW
jgi:hypothetical protein